MTIIGNRIINENCSCPPNTYEDYKSEFCIIPPLKIGKTVEVCPIYLQGLAITFGILTFIMSLGFAYLCYKYI